MPLINRFAETHAEITAIRRDLHENPELQFDCHRTAGIVADKLREWGCDEVKTGWENRCGWGHQRPSERLGQGDWLARRYGRLADF